MKKVWLICFSGLLCLSACTASKQEDMKKERSSTIQNVAYKTKQSNKTPVTTIGYIEPFNEQKAIAEVKKNARHLSYTAIFSYQVKQDGSLIAVKDEKLIKEIKKQGSLPMFVLTNFENGTFSPSIAHALFTNQQAMNTVISQVLTTMKNKRYAAINVDFEHIKPEDKTRYNTFLHKLLSKAKANGYVTSTALAPKTSGTQSGPWYTAHDYKTHGQLADYVVLMTYEWGWSGGPPMAVAPITEVRKVLEYALSEIPRTKIILGAPLYGYDWPLPYKKGNPFAKRISPEGAAQLAIDQKIPLQYDARVDAPYFYYRDATGKKHVVWFENEASMQAKYNLVKEKGIRGVAYWVLGEPFARNWSLVEDRFSINRGTK
ncbi:hypothetical protein A374_10178 [Fictibacillus macauensis ZFHKF-1]|uniref:GH18 domain-containing protein n=1 Tax=Fictibacillus macauensis ZFHKF-1 TaxID=1196324 RepID=I8UFC5_9BACL|nr:glycosyl hydrolase family 18 protein [Fictibacillus macauensis]EIT85595.1 hypothetical protein A374_10178 [Fictibacillus macauensis ZFHKF-1]